MKPNFALSLSHEGISLLHRAKTGWNRVGDVSLESPDLKQQLAELRQAANGLDPDGLTCKLVIPSSQVLYTEVATSDPDKIRASLDGLTPYDVEDLVFDWHPIPGADRAQVAVVARETLREAESFAAEFKFNPVSLVALGGDDSFAGEPFFGMTDGAAALLGEGVAVEPDTETTVAEAARPPAKPKAAKASKAKKGALPDAAADAPEETPPKKTRRKTYRPKAAKAGDTNTAKAAAPTINLAENVAAKSDQPPSATAAEPTQASAAPPATELGPTEDAPPPALSFSSRRRTPDQPAAAPKSGGAAITEPLPDVPASAGVATFSALDLDDVPDMPAWREAGGGPALDTDVSPTQSAAPGATRAALVGASARLGIRPFHTRGDAIKASDKEAKAMTVFGARSAPVVGGKPKHLGLILTALLLLAFGVAALWSMLFLDGDAPDGQEIAALPNPITVPETEPPSASDTDSETGAPSAVETAIVETLAPPEAEQPVPGADADAATALPQPEELAQLETTPPVVEAPPPDRVSEAPPTQDEAERRYATTGIWQLDPPPLPEPVDAGQLEGLQTASIDPTLSALTFSDLPGVSPDQRPATLLPPRRLRASFDLDERGLVAATAEGNLSPDGTLVFLGTPPLVPGVRPGTEAPQLAALPDPAAPIPDPSPDPAPEPTTPVTGTADGSTDVAPADPQDPEVSRNTVNTALEAAVEGAVGAVTGGESPAPESPAQEPPAPLTPEQELLFEFKPAPRPTGFDDSQNLNAEDLAPDGDAESDFDIAAIIPAPRPPSIQEEAASDDPSLETGDATELAIEASAIPSGRPSNVRAQAAALAEQRRRVAEQNQATTTPSEETRTPEPNVEVAAAVAPRIPSRASVAKAATEQNAIKLNKVNLIGVYGSASDRRALVRLKSGRYVKVEVGDRVDGGRVAAIGNDELRYVKGGRNITLKLPQG